MDSLEKQRKELESKAGKLILNAEKPFRKMEKLIKAGKFIPQDYSFKELNKWVFSAGEAIKSDQKGLKIKRACSDCIEAISTGKLSAKNEKEKMKWVDALNEIHSVDFFGEFFWKINSIESKKNSIQAELEKNSLNEEILEQEKKMRLLEAKLNELNAAKERLEREINVLNEKLIEAKKEIEKKYSDSFNAIQLK
jgi:hypothetical protein